MSENELADNTAQDAVASPAAQDGAQADKPAETPVEPEAQAPAAAPEAGDNSDDEKRRNRRSAQERIAQLTRQKRELQEEVERFRASVAKPPKQEDFGDDYDAYERAKVKHAAREALVDDRQEMAKAHEEQFREALKQDWQANVTTFKANAPDFDAVVNRPDLQVTAAMAETIMAMGDEGPALAYHLGKNPHEAARLASLPPSIAAVELGRIAERVKAPPRRTVSSAPPPVAPVVGSGGITSKDPAKMSYAEYRAMRMGK